VLHKNLFGVLDFCHVLTIGCRNIVPYRNLAHLDAPPQSPAPYPLQSMFLFGWSWLGQSFFDISVQMLFVLPLGASGNHWEPLAVSGSLWEPLGITGSLWEPLGAFGSFGEPLEICVSQNAWLGQCNRARNDPAMIYRL
jgi:hypothetical protein